MNCSRIQIKLTKLLANLLLVLTLIIAELGMLSAPALADFQLQTAITLRTSLATVSRQSMAATQNKAGDFAKSKGQLDKQLTRTVTNVTTDIQDATSGVVKTAKRKASTDTQKLEEAAQRTKKRAQKDIGQVQDSAEELGETLQERAESVLDDL